MLPAPEPTSIEQSQCVVASWSTGGGTTRVQLLRDGAAIWDNAPLNGSVQDCPPNAAPATVKYTLVAYNNAGQQDARDVPVQITAAPPQNPLANTNWQLQRTEMSGMVPPDVTVIAFFGAEGSLSGNAGCNPYNSTYVVSDQVITIHQPVAGMALCGDPADSVEQNYLRLLPQAANFRIEGGQLVITNNSGIEILRYDRIG